MLAGANDTVREVDGVGRQGGRERWHMMIMWRFVDNDAVV